MPYVVTVRDTGVYDFHAVADRKDAILHHLLIVDGKFKMYEFLDDAEKAVKALNKERLARQRALKRSQGWLFEEGK